MKKTGTSGAKGRRKKKDKSAGEPEYCSSCGCNAVPGRLLCEECIGLGIVTDLSLNAEKSGRKG